MALHWRPVGPETEQTYWMRRAAVALAVLVPLAVLLSLLGGGDQDRLAQRSSSTTTASPLASPLPTPLSSALPSADPSASPQPGASPGVTPTPSASAAGTACPDDALRLEAAATEDSYAVGASPRLELSVTNSGAVPCRRDLGQAAVELVVFSGSDRIWSSDDCAPGGEADVVTLAPGAAEVSRVTWGGTRSLPGCEGDEDRAEAGTYRVTGRVGELRVEGGSFQLR